MFIMAWCKMHSFNFDALNSPTPIYHFNNYRKWWKNISDCQTACQHKLVLPILIVMTN